MLAAHVALPMSANGLSHRAVRACAYGLEDMWKDCVYQIEAWRLLQVVLQVEVLARIRGPVKRLELKVSCRLKT